MSKIMFVVLVMCLTLLGCTSETQFGKCVGVTEQQDPKLVYYVPTNNVIIGVLFSESMIVPALVLLKETYCPAGLK